MEIWQYFKRFEERQKEHGQALKSILARMDEKNFTFNAPIGHLQMCAGMFVYSVCLTFMKIFCIFVNSLISKQLCHA